MIEKRLSRKITGLGLDRVQFFRVFFSSPSLMIMSHTLGKYTFTRTKCYVFIYMISCDGTTEKLQLGGSNSPLKTTRKQ